MKQTSCNKVHTNCVKQPRVTRDRQKRVKKTLEERESRIKGKPDRNILRNILKAKV
jgi:hypothetical protein